MALSQKMELRQGQSLVMTPQLQQAIKLLQMSSSELQAFVESELERNPLLERVETSELPKVKTVSPEPLPPPDSGWASLKPGGGMPLDGEDYDFTATLAREKTLAEHLTDQLNFTITDPSDRIIGQNLIGMVNEAGYLTATPADIATYLGTTTGHVTRVLGILKTFDPVGVFAETLEECLSLQLKERDRLDPAMAILVKHLNLVARMDFQALKTLCRVDLEDIKDMIAEIRALNPKPGNAFGSEPVQPVVPDVFVRAAQDGSWLVELNTETLPRILLSNQYASKVSLKTSRQQDKNYISECHTTATWLIKSLDQRAKTILKVAREIVRQQDAFLVLGVQHLKPITLKVVAEAIEMHESTVSRVTSNKYIATPRGTYELKYFFTTALASSLPGNDSHSAESVRQRIREMIAREDASSILSDDTIVEKLQLEGIEIARRTVAKYRESLNIPSSVQRRRKARS